MKTLRSIKYDIKKLQKGEIYRRIGDKYGNEIYVYKGIKDLTIEDNIDSLK